MTVDAASFKVEFPEFAAFSDDLVTAKLAASVLQTPSGTWGDLQDEGVKYLCGHLLILLPQSRQLRTGNMDTPSHYLKERERLERVVSYGYRTT